MSRRLANGLVLGGAVGVALLAFQHYSHWLAGSAKTFVMDRERCYGVVRAGRNDCGTALHACAGQAAADAVESEWLMLPAGNCEKIAGSRTWNKEEG